MKISKILAAVSAMAVAASLAIPASAGKGAPIGVPGNGWTLDAKKTLATRTLIGEEKDSPAFGANEDATWEKLFPASVARITVQGDYFGEEGWDASGSIVITSHSLGWGQVDWQLGAGCYNMNDDGTIKEVNPEKNEFVNKIYVKDGNKYTIEVTLKGLNDSLTTNTDIGAETGFFTVNKTYAEGLGQEYANVCVQSFNEDTTKSWNVIGFELADANGNSVFKEGDVAMGDVYDPAAALNGGDTKTDDKSSDDSKSSDDKSGSAASGSAASGSASTTSGSSSSKGSSKSTSGSDSSSDTGAASGLALAGIALAGAAFVISKKK